MTVDLSGELCVFFRERLLEASSRRKGTLSPEAETYVVGLLMTYAASPPLETPLVEQLAEALESVGSDRARRFRALGDSALCSSGFFPDFLERRGVSRDYVMSMGGRAYRAAAGSTLGILSSVLPELAERFEYVAAVLADVRETTVMRTPQDVVRLYERWNKTKSPLIADRLKEVGVFPQMLATTKTFH